jgi:hypothetical protein
MKDPIAVLSSEWLAETFHMKVVALIRHPAAFASSLKQAGWTHPFHDFLEQSKLMDEYLEGYRSDIETFARYEQDIVDQAALLWVILHTVLYKYLDRNPGWYLTRYGDLSRDPVRVFEEIFNFIDVPYNESLQAAVWASSRKGEKLPKGLHPSFQRDSQANTKRWKERLSQDEIRRVRNRVEPLSSRFYQESDWR